MSKEIELFFWATPNGWKISIALEEMQLPYKLNMVDISKGDQFKPEFLKISPNNRMPAIIDPVFIDGAPISVFESGAILQYLARKTGKFYGKNDRERILIDQWLFWQMAGLGPMAGQASHYRNYAPNLVDDQKLIEYGRNRYFNEAKRLFGVLDKQLANNEFIAGEYSIADMACFPWIRAYEFVGQDLKEFENLSNWYDVINSRPAVQKGLAVGKESRRDQAKLSKEEIEEQARNLFGKK